MCTGLGYFVDLGIVKLFLKVDEPTAGFGGRRPIPPHAAANFRVQQIL